MVPRQLKICQLCAVDFTIAKFLMPLISALQDRGHSVTAVCSDGPLLDVARNAGVEISAIEIARSFNLIAHVRSYRRLVRLFRQCRFDIVHTHTPIASVIGRLAAARARVPTIAYTAHGFYFHDRMRWWKRAPFIALEWIAGRTTHIIFTQSAEDAATARRLRLCRTGVVEAIGNGVDPAIFSPDPTGQMRARVRSARDTATDRPVIMVVGRLVAEKGYPELIAAMRQVDAELWVVGARLTSDRAGGVAESLAAAETDPVLRARVRLLGERDDVPDLLRAADIFCLPSHREGMPRSIIEAMMTGLPVVATDIRGSREEVVDSQTGLLVPVNDTARLAAALNTLVQDNLLRTRLGTAGRARAVDLFDEALVIARQFKRLGI